MTSNTYENKPTEYFGQSRPEMMQFVPDSVQTLLEIGCGEGDFVALLKSKRSVHATGVEPFPAAAAIARQRFDVLLENSLDVALVQIQGQKFDCIVFNDVLEHLVDPWAALRLVKPLLAENGCVVASIPNVRFWPVLNALFLRASWIYTDAGVLDRTHLRFFTRSTIRDLFDSVGLKVNRMEGINKIELPLKISLLNRLTGRRFDDTQFTQFACVARIV